MQPPRSASAEGLYGGAHTSRAHYSPPAVNFNPLSQAAAAMAAAAAAGMLAEQGSAPMTGSGSGVGATAGLQGHLQQQEQQQHNGQLSPQQQEQAGAAQLVMEAAGAAGVAAAGSVPYLQVEDAAASGPGSPSHDAQGNNSQLGQQQDGSRGSPPLGMGRVGSVPPPEEQQGGAAAGHQAGLVVDQALPAASQHTASEGAGEQSVWGQQGLLDGGCWSCAA
jgi:hypothetical protein